MDKQAYKQTDAARSIIGRYRHFKGGSYYVFGAAFDRNGVKYILYQQDYGDKSFWLRPYDMFFDTVTMEDGTSKLRFEKLTRKPKDGNHNIGQLIELMESQALYIRHSETEQEYIISHINTEDGTIIVHPFNTQYPSGYLTEYELFRRLGYTACRINGAVRHFKLRRGRNAPDSLRIGENRIEEIAQRMNPCSIDMPVAISSCLCTKFRLVDPQSVETVSTAEELWKPVRIHKSKAGTPFIKLHPGKTFLTHLSERVKIPNDCAGKVEIKSTFARLSLSITSGDFCNPGYDGLFPIEITNYGKHTIIIHEKETMAQMMLIPLHGPILEEYPTQATFINEDGFDDGTPYTFWRERSIRALRSKAGTQQIVELSQKVLASVNEKNTSDVNAFRDKFNDTFLPFCQQHISCARFQDAGTGLPDAKKLLRAYYKREKHRKSIYNINWASGIVGFLIAVVPSIISIIASGTEQKFDPSVHIQPFWPYISIGALLFVSAIILAFRRPKFFCTFEKIDLDRL